MCISSPAGVHFKSWPPFLEIKFDSFLFIESWTSSYVEESGHLTSPRRWSDLYSLCRGVALPLCDRNNAARVDKVRRDKWKRMCQAVARYLDISCQIRTADKHKELVDNVLYGLSRRTADAIDPPQCKRQWQCTRHHDLDWWPRQRNGELGILRSWPGWNCDE